jgi:hypothetical protein
LEKPLLPVNQEPHPESGAVAVWGFHVAPATLVLEEGAVEIVVLDPTLMDGPSKLDSWRRNMSDGKARVYVTDISVFDLDVESGGWNYCPPEGQDTAFEQKLALDAVRR